MNKEFQQLVAIALIVIAGCQMIQAAASLWMSIDITAIRQQL